MVCGCFVLEDSFSFCEKFPLRKTSYSSEQEPLTLASQELALIFSLYCDYLKKIVYVRPGWVGIDHPGYTRLECQVC